MTPNPTPERLEKSNCLQCGNNPHSVELCDDCEQEVADALRARAALSEK